MQRMDNQTFARAMYILGQIGAIVCHERGPKTDTSILTEMASNPARGFWLALSSIDESLAPLRGMERVLVRWKRKEIARLGRTLPQPIPNKASAQEQMPFWAGYCQYWDDVLKTHAISETDGLSSRTDETHRRHINA
jgi:hypothetical protein